MNKYRIAIPLLIIVFSTYSSAFFKVSSNFEHKASKNFQSFKEYKDYRIEQLNSLKINGIVDKNYIESEIRKLQTFEAEYTLLEITKFNNLNFQDPSCSFEDIIENNSQELDVSISRKKTSKCVNN